MLICLINVNLVGNCLLETFTLARVIHILSIVIWIGGVSMVTTVIIPSIKRLESKDDKINTFERIEGKFAIQAKITTLLTAITGFYMIYRLDAWDRYLDISYWWIHAMTLVWLLFTVILFILEPYYLHKLFRKYATDKPDKAFRIIQRAHWVLLSISLITILGSVAGSHGWLFF